MNEMIKILVTHQVNFSVEFFARQQKVRVRKSGVWDRNKLWEIPVFADLANHGYQHAPGGIQWSSTGSTPLVMVEYHFDHEEKVETI